ncbi:MAG TPA: Sec-independent protein translocase protein TatB [Burkholderiales bacterium]
MFDIGFSELLLIALVGLIVIGPKRLPEVARTVGQWVAKVRRFVADVKQDIDREMQQAELSELRNLKQELEETRRVVEQTSSSLIKEANIAAPPETAGVSPTVPTPSIASATPSVAALAEADATRPSPPSRRKPRTTKRRKKSLRVHARS